MGSAFAVVEVRALLHAEIIGLCSALPRLTITVYVDDIRVGAAECTHRARAKALRRGCLALREAVERRCGLPLDPGKLALPATSPATLQAVAEAIPLRS